MTDASGRRFDVVVVGAGPAGLAAAQEAASSGGSVLLIDSRAGGGGQVWRNAHLVGPPRARQMLAAVEASGVECCWRAGVVSADADARWLQLCVDAGGPEQPITERVSYQRLVLATGARELFLPFPGWTLPGVVGVGGLQAMIKSGARLDDQRVLITGSGPLLLPVAALAARVGAKVLGVAEQTPRSELAWFAQSLWRHPAKALSAVALRSRFLTTWYRAGHWVQRVRSDGNELEVDLTDGRREQTIRCDLVTATYGLVPASELGLLLGCAADDDGALTVDEEQRTSTDGVFAAGELTGVGGADLAILEGRIAGAAAAGRQPKSSWGRRRTSLHSFATAMAAAFKPRHELLRRLQPDTLVCRCEDVPWGAVDPDAGPRQTKLLTRCGMGVCQGRTCMPALRTLCGWSELPVVRPPIEPAPISALTLEATTTTEAPQ